MALRIDCHNDTVGFFNDHPSLERLPQAHLDYQRLRAYLDAAFFAIFVDQKEYAGREAPRFSSVLDKLRADLAGQPDFQLLLGRDQLEKPQPQRHLVLVSMEGAAPLGQEAEHLTDYYGRGLRAVGLTWNYDTAYAGAAAAGGGGLTPAGQRLVARCNRLGVLLDAAHGSSQTLADLLKYSKAPIIDSHTVCGALGENRWGRCLSDEELRALAAQGGVAGLAFVPDFLGGDGGLDRLCEHIEHAVALVGSAHVALGADFDGTEMHPAYAGVQHLPKLYQRLQQRGMSCGDIDNVAGESVRRLLLQVLPA